ncbi:MAG: diguanylate cyclase [Gammaproteobacteria bacterium]|nr:diguanylate cyclase [Gammaproteobacteria bacterium]
MCDLTLNDIMKTDVDLVKPDTDLGTIVNRLANSEYSCCIIATKKNVPLGTLSEMNLIRIIGNSKNVTKPLSQQASQHMESPPFTLPVDTTLVEAIQWVEKRNINTVLVTAVDGELLGIVTPSELAIAYNRVMRHHTETLELTVQKRTEQLEKVNRKLITISMVDALTGLGNRRAMEVDIMRAHAACIRHRRPYSIALFDIDFFKKYNDHYGHQAGDNILQLVANHFKKSVRDSDSVYRYGGEEFLILMPETNEEEALIPIQRIIDGLAELSIPHVESPMTFITSSAGIASSHHQGQRLSNWRKVVELADDGLYEAKGAGRNQLSISTTNILKAVQ